MTKYILHGGRTSYDSPSNREYFLETINIDKKSIKLLVVLFSRDKEVWEEKFNQYKQIFLNLHSDKDIEFVLAEPDQQIFSRQVLDADVIFILGGETILLMSYLKNIPNLKELFENKVISGSSAGANFLSKYYYTINGKEVRHGLGWI